MELTETTEGSWCFTEDTLNSACSRMLCLFALLNKEEKADWFLTFFLRIFTFLFHSFIYFFFNFTYFISTNKEKIQNVIALKYHSPLYFFFSFVDGTIE